MRSRDIDREARRSFFRDLTRAHEGALVTMSVATAATPAWDEVIDQPLVGVSDDGNDVIVQIGTAKGALHLSHRIVDVESVRLQQSDEGADAEVDFNGTDDSRTVVRFHSPALPELLDPGVE